MLQDTDELNKFNIIEFAEGGPYHTGVFKNVSETPNTDGKEDCYHSVFLHSEKIEEYYEARSAEQKTRVKRIL